MDYSIMHYANTAPSLWWILLIVIAVLGAMAMLAVIGLEVGTGGDLLCMLLALAIGAGGLVGGRYIMYANEQDDAKSHPDTDRIAAVFHLTPVDGVPGTYSNISTHAFYEECVSGFTKVKEGELKVRLECKHNGKREWVKVPTGDKQ